MNSTIRPMANHDLEDVRRLASLLGYQTSHENIQNRFDNLKNDRHHGLFVLEASGIKGWIHLEKVFSLIYPDRVEIKALVVDENERGKGHGTALLQEARNWAKSTGAGTIYLSANIMRDKSHAFYLKNGFTKIKTSHFFEMTI